MMNILVSGIHNFRRVATAATVSASLVSGISAAHAADDVSLQLSWLAQGQASALFYGIQKGCFSERDINLKVQRGYGALDTVAKVATGTAQFGQVDIGTLITAVAKTGAPLKAVMPLFSDSPVAIGVVVGGPVKTLKDLEGRILAAGPNDGGTLLLPAAMEQEGADASKVVRKSIEPAALAGSLLQGQVDGILTYTTTAAGINAVAQKAGKSVTSIDFGKLLGIYGDVIATSDELLKSNSGLVDRFVDGMRCAYRGAYENQEEAVRAMVSTATEMNYDRELMLAKLGWALVFESSSPALEWDDKRIARSAEITAKAQQLPSVPSADSFVRK